MKETNYLEHIVRNLIPSVILLVKVSVNERTLGEPYTYHLSGAIFDNLLG